VSIHPNQEPPTVRLPTDMSSRHIEALHELAWRDLLDLVPGAMQGLIDQAASEIGTTGKIMATGATISFDGGCGSDLFVTCNECRRDRAVIEIKGPTAWLNLTKKGVWQTDLYRDRYQNSPALACEHLPLPSPLFILLDARNRTQDEIEQIEGVYEPLSLDGWAVLAYEKVLSMEPFINHPLAQWLLGR
jgi:hypothetical protein